MPMPSDVTAKYSAAKFKLMTVENSKFTYQNRVYHMKGKRLIGSINDIRNCLLWREMEHLL